MEEIWHQIAEARNYEVSDQGNVRNKKTGRILKQHPNNITRRPQVTLMDAHFRLTQQVHTLVKDAFDW
jgi:hypothetical protein